jgi:16S rRNA (guanine527-N7)-methyltransferase
MTGEHPAVGALRGVLGRARSGGLPVTEETGPRIERLVDLLLKHGERLSLLSRGELRAGRLLERHFADSIGGLIVAAPEEGTEVLDFGAGAGIVGLVWSIFRPDLAVTLLESRRRKCAFLRMAVGELALSGAKVWEGRGEEPGERAGSFHLIASRGVATEKETLAVFAALLRPGGRLLLFKGPETASAAADRVRAHGRYALLRESIRLLGEEKKRIYLLAELET